MITYRDKNGFNEAELKGYQPISRKNSRSNCIQFSPFQISDKTLYELTETF